MILKFIMLSNRQDGVRHHRQSPTWGPLGKICCTWSREVALPWRVSCFCMFGVQGFVSVLCMSAPCGRFGRILKANIASLHKCTQRVCTNLANVLPVKFIHHKSTYRDVGLCTSRLWYLNLPVPLFGKKACGAVAFMHLSYCLIK